MGPLQIASLKAILTRTLVLALLPIALLAAVLLTSGAAHAQFSSASGDAEITSTPPSVGTSGAEPASQEDASPEPTETQSAPVMVTPTSRIGTPRPTATQTRQAPTSQTRETSNEETMTVVALIDRGDTAFAAGEIEDALAAYKDALDLARTRDDKGGMVDVYGRILRLQQKSGEHADAIDTLETLLELQDELGDLNGTVVSLIALADSYGQLGQSDDAVDYYLSAFDLALEMGNSTQAMNAQKGLGELYAAENDYAEAVEAYTTGAELAQKAEDETRANDFLNRIALAYRANGKYVDSTETFEELLAIQRDAGDIAGQAGTQAYIGSNFAEQEDVDQAIEYYSSAVEMAKDVDNLGLAINVLKAEGNLQRDVAEDVDAAVDAYDRALELASSPDYEDQYLDILVLKGNLLRADARFADSSEVFSEALDIYSSREDMGNVARMSALIGANWIDAGNLDDAERFLDDAVEAAISSGDSQLAISVRRAQGDAYADDGDSTAAQTAYLEALELARGADDADSEVYMLERIAGLLRSTGEYEASNDYYSQVLEIYEKRKDLAALAQTSAVVGANYAALRSDETVPQYEKAIDYALQAEDLALSAKIYAALSDYYVDIGRTTSAVEALNEAVTLAEKAEDTQLIINVLGDLASIYQKNRSLGQANAVLERILVLQRELDDDTGMAQTLAQIGANYAAMESSDTAAHYFDQAIDAAERAEEQEYVAVLLRAKGKLLADLARYSEAIPAMEQGAKVLRDLGDRSHYASVMQELSQVYLDSGQVDAALQTLDTAQQYVGSGGDAASLIQILLAQGNILWRQGRQDDAWEKYTEALEVAQNSSERSLQVDPLYKLAAAHASLRHFEEALATYEQLLDVTIAIGDGSAETSVRQKMWDAYLRTRQFSAADAIVNQNMGIHSPANGAIVSGVVTIEGLATDPEFSKWQIDLLLNGDEGSATFIGVSEDLPRSKLRYGNGRTWGKMLDLDTTQFPNGTHKLRLRVVRRGGNYDEYFTTITIAN